ncbi:MAG: MFS transporter, partial [Candidatus Eiseniibacteriota bacterium]
VATQMRRQGLGPAEIGAFVGSLYLPWAFKWIAGPFVDTFTSEKLGRRRTWILLTQVGLVLALLAAWPVNFATELKLFTLLLLIHNSFAAVQDVAIDALAVDVLPESERGVANGFMFGGAYFGQAVGGSGALFLAAHVPFSATYFYVAACLMLVTLFVTLPLKEPARAARVASVAVGSRLLGVLGQIRKFVMDVLRAFFGSRGAFVGLITALLPAGAYALGLALQTNLAVELGLDDTAVATLTLWSTIISALGCVAGGWLSDRFGRRKMLALFLFATAIPTLWLAWKMQQAGWIQPVPPDMANRPVPSPALLTVFWISVLIYNVFQGLYYGIRSALYMDVTSPQVAATQFTAYMALNNFVITYTATWQGLAVTRFGYPNTLVFDSIAGLLPIALLPLMTPPKRKALDPGKEYGKVVGPGSNVPEAISP